MKKIMKKRNAIGIFAVILCGIVMFSGCESKKSAVDEKKQTDIQEENDTKGESAPQESDSTQEAGDSTEENYMNICQPRGIRYNGEDYLAMQNGIYKIDEAGDTKKVLECKDAVGIVYDEVLYWAVLRQDDTTCLVKLGEDGEFVELGEAENTLSLKDMDCDGEHLYVRNVLGAVEGYALNGGESIGDRLSDEAMEIYKEDNEIAEKRQENTYEPSADGDMPYHFIGAGYSEKVYGAQFVIKHVSDGEEGTDALLMRKDGTEEELLRFYDDALIYKNRIVYASSLEKNELSVYDMEDNSDKVVYTFDDGSFELKYVDDETAYGIWDSAKQGKTYVGIDLESGEKEELFEAEDEKDYIQIGKNVYYAGENESEILCK